MKEWYKSFCNMYDFLNLMEQFADLLNILKQSNFFFNNDKLQYLEIQFLFHCIRFWLLKCIINYLDLKSNLYSTSLQIPSFICISYVVFLRAVRFHVFLLHLVYTWHIIKYKYTY